MEVLSLSLSLYIYLSLSLTVTTVYINHVATHHRRNPDGKFPGQNWTGEDNEVRRSLRGSTLCSRKAVDFLSDVPSLSVLSIMLEFYTEVLLLSKISHSHDCGHL
jgi:hypothetical protein